MGKLLIISLPGKRKWTNLHIEIKNNKNLSFAQVKNICEEISENKSESRIMQLSSKKVKHFLAINILISLLGATMVGLSFSNGGTPFTFGISFRVFIFQVGSVAAVPTFVSAFLSILALIGYTSWRKNLLWPLMNYLSWMPIAMFIFGFVWTLLVCSLHVLAGFSTFQPFSILDALMFYIYHILLSSFGWLAYYVYANADVNENLHYDYLHMAQYLNKDELGQTPGISLTLYKTDPSISLRSLEIPNENFPWMSITLV